MLFIFHLAFHHQQQNEKVLNIASRARKRTRGTYDSCVVRVHTTKVLAQSGSYLLTDRTIQPYCTYGTGTYEQDTQQCEAQNQRRAHTPAHPKARTTNETHRSRTRGREERDLHVVIRQQTATATATSSQVEGITQKAFEQQQSESINLPL